MRIRITKNIQYGNVCDVSVRSSKNQAEVSFSASPQGGPESLWFCFRITAINKIKRIKIVLKHPYNMLMGGCELSNILPVIRKDKGNWQRIERNYEFLALPDGRYEISWILNNPGKINEISLCYPYGAPEIETLVKESKGYWKKDTIGVSTENRPMIRLSNDYSFPDSKKPGIYIVARQHSGETPGSLVLDGFLRYLSEIRNKESIVWAVPLVNIDGIEKGYYGKDNYPIDVNRAWGNPSMRHETLVIQRDINRWKERCTPILGIDFHAPGGAQGDGIYFFLQKEKSAFMNKERSLINIIEKKIGKTYMAKQCAVVAQYRERWNGLTFSQYCRKYINIPGLCVEIPYAFCGKNLLTQKKYQEIGKKIACAIIETLK